MFNILKFQNLSKVFVVSDCHFQHDRDFVWKRRGFDSIQQHDRGLIAAWNERVTHEDVVFHLGDFVFRDAGGYSFLNLLDQLNFDSFYLCPGNHPSGVKKIYFDNLKKQFGENINFEVYPLKMDYYKNVFFLPNLFDIEVDKIHFNCCHYPIISHLNQNRGSYHICGHSHSNCPITNKDTGQGRRLDVGIESFGGPISLKYVVDFLKNRSIDSVDHHS